MEQNTETSNTPPLGKPSVASLPPPWRIVNWIRFFGLVAAFLIAVWIMICCVALFEHAEPNQRAYKCKEKNREEFIEARFRELSERTWSGHPDEQASLTTTKGALQHNGVKLNGWFFHQPGFFSLTTGDGSKVRMFAHSFHWEHRERPLYGDVLIALSPSGQQLIATNYHVCRGALLTAPTTNGFQNFDEFLMFSISPFGLTKSAFWLPYDRAK